MTIFVDLEGTLTDHSARLAILLRDQDKYKERDRTAWRTYYKGLLDDPPHPHILELIHGYIGEGMRPLIYSTRFINKYHSEEAWLRKYDLWNHIDLLQRQPYQTKIKGPDLVVQWVRAYAPAVIIDDREEVRQKVRELNRGIIAYPPEAFLDEDRQES